MPLDFVEVYHVEFDKWHHDALCKHLTDEWNVHCQLANQLHESRDAVRETRLPNCLRLGHFPDEVGQLRHKFFLGELVEHLVKEAEEDVLERCLLVVTHVARGAVQFAHDFEVFFTGRLIFALRLLVLVSIFRTFANEHFEVVDHLFSNIVLLDVFELNLCYSAVFATAFFLPGILTAGAALSLVVAFTTFASFGGSGVVVLTHGGVLFFHVDLLGGLFVVLFAPTPIVALASVTVTATLIIIIVSLRFHFLHFFFLDLLLGLELFILAHVLLPASLLVLKHVLDQQFGSLGCLKNRASAIHDFVKTTVNFCLFFGSGLFFIGLFRGFGICNARL